MRYGLTEDDLWDAPSYRIRGPRFLGCSDRMCGAEDCPNCYPGNKPDEEEDDDDNE